MRKLDWQTVRIPLLVVTLGCTVLAIANVATAPKADPSAEPTNVLPATAPLANWQFLGSAAIQPNPDSKFGHRYRYRRGERSLDVELQYMVSDGNVSRYLFVYSPVKTANANLKIKHQSGVGSYGILNYKGQAYLSACINPRGESTVSEQQFTQNRYAHDLRADRIVPWILGRESLIDHRCLWTLMATPLKATSPSDAIASDREVYTDLETAWFSWHQWWQSNFPAP